jgi:hypothetical protein
MSLVLLVPTRRAILSKPPVSSGTIIKILKLRRSLDAYIANRLTIIAFVTKPFCSVFRLQTPTQLPARNHSTYGLTKKLRYFKLTVSFLSL